MLLDCVQPLELYRFALYHVPVHHHSKERASGRVFHKHVYYTRRFTTMSREVVLTGRRTRLKYLKRMQRTEHRSRPIGLPLRLKTLARPMHLSTWIPSKLLPLSLWNIV